MPRKWDDILRAEEKIGGFNAGTADDETFMGDMIGGFPGDVPYDHRNAEERAKDISNQSETPQFETTSQAEPSGVAQFESAQTDAFNAQTPQFESDVFAENANAQFENASENAVETGQFETSQDFVFPNEPQFESSAVNSQPEPKFEAQAPVQQEGIGSLVDDDLLQMLQADLDKAKTKPSKKEKITSEVSPQTETPPEFKPVEEQFETETIDISSLGFDKPSNSGAIVEPTAAIAAEQAKDNAEKKKKEKKVKQPKIKKERKPLPRKVWYIAASILLLGLLGAGAYIYLNEKSAVQFANAPLEEVSASIKKQEAEKLKKEKEELRKKEDAKKAQEELAKADTTVKEAVEEPSHKAEPEKKVAALEPIKEVKQKESSHKEVKSIEKEIPKKIIAKPETKKTDSKIAHNEPIKKENIEKKHSSKPIKEKVAHSEPTEKPKKQAEPKKKKVDSNKLYVVQLYSTPLKEDADRKLAQVKKKWNGSAFIQEQKIRDQVWRQVRIGNFTSKEEAENAAREIGAKQYWIDRIR